MISIKKRFGFDGESIAAKYLKKNGYKILERNYLCKIGEIDIIAEIDGTIVFVEVKRRAKIDFGVPSDNVNYAKRKKISNIANFYVLTNKTDALTRFDVIEIIGKKVNHIVGAFYADNM